jgi:hypothetical protein
LRQVQLKGFWIANALNMGYALAAFEMNMR